MNSFNMWRMRFALALVCCMQPALACCDTELKEPSAAVQVIEPRVTTHGTDRSRTLSVFGELQNNTPSRIDNLVVEAKVLDGKGQVVDVLTESVYGVAVPPGQKVAFRMQGTAAAPTASYVSVQARVINGEIHPETRPPRNEAAGTVQPFLSFLYNWSPFLILLFVFSWVARKSLGKKAAPWRMVDLLTEQNALMARQVAALESLSETAKSMRDSRGA